MNRGMWLHTEASLQRQLARMHIHNIGHDAAHLQDQRRVFCVQLKRRRRFTEKDITYSKRSWGLY